MQDKIGSNHNSTKEGEPEISETGESLPITINIIYITGTIINSDLQQGNDNQMKYEDCLTHQERMKLSRVIRVMKEYLKSETMIKQREVLDDCLRILEIQAKLTRPAREIIIQTLISIRDKILEYAPTASVTAHIAALLLTL